jgi:Mannosylglycerate hydrolase MGH1-like glycoside hydrolase domain
MSTTRAVPAEQQRLHAADNAAVGWRRWGPYLSERQWGTVREDYSDGGDAWGSFSHDQARSRAYRWGEDGIGGFSDDEQRLCLAFAMWNGRDPILKERFFGLTNGEGNHGEDVKEYYYYLDGTPTHSYMRMLYKYPQGEYPYADLVATNRSRGPTDFEYELLDTGIFADSRYFDLVVEYAKASPDDMLARVTVHNRGPSPATLRLLPTVWFRNTWSGQPDEPKPYLTAVPGVLDQTVIAATHRTLGQRWLLCQGAHPLLFTENETNNERLYGTPNASPYVKDGIGRAVVEGAASAVNPENNGTKAAVDVALEVPAGGTATVRLRLTDEADAWCSAGAFDGFDELVEQRRAEADEFYDQVMAAALPGPERLVCRQAFAGMLWSKQYYGYDVERWLTEHGRDPLDARGIRNGDWFHMVDHDVIAMPDTWEYPWFAAWDLALHAVVLGMVDVTFAKNQLELLLSRRYLHPNGQIPAYEWNFSDVNPPVHAWAVYLMYELAKARTGDGDGDRAWLERMFHKLAQNFTWWINRKDVEGRNVFQGGFLGLDNIGVFDRSAPLPTGGYLEQADGTAWMALYCQNMLQIALELAQEDPVYLESAQTFVEHFAWIMVAVNHGTKDDATMWDEDDGFFYDLLRLPDGNAYRLKVRSMVGLLPLAAATVLSPDLTDRFPGLLDETRDFVARHPSIASMITAGRFRGEHGHHVLALFDEPRLRRILAKMLDEAEFLGPYGIRSLSRYHAEHPFTLDVSGSRYEVAYLPAESDSGMFGGNSNWRGPIWFPVNGLMIRALLNLYVGYGADFTVEYPTGSGVQKTLFEVAQDIAGRLTSIFLPGPDGRRPCYGGQLVFRDDEHWRDLLTFSEYFHGDNGAGLGASHQTGWTGLVAVFANLFAGLDGATLQEHGMVGALRSRAARGGEAAEGSEPAPRTGTDAPTTAATP